MPVAETGSYPRAAELDSFLELATRELAAAVGSIGIYADLLDAQVAADPGTSGIHEIVRELREQALLVGALVSDLAPPPLVPR